MMVLQSKHKKTALFSLNFVPLRELVVTLKEGNEESLSGGTNKQPYRDPPEGELAWSIGFSDVVRPN
jgi:hypothetical protein